MLRLFLLLSLLFSAVSFANEEQNKKLPVSPQMQAAMERLNQSDKVVVDGLTSAQRFAKYFFSGIDHIVPKGIDHILFVMGLFFSTLVFSRLFWQVTAFTVAHSITLILAATGWITVSGAIVEPLIALSIVYIAYENIRHNEPQPNNLKMIFIFGLLHGLGFASVLMEFGLPTASLVTSLLAFNIGVEVGQLMVLVACALLFYHWSKKPTYRAFVQVPVSLLIGAVGCYWVIERTIL